LGVSGRAHGHGPPRVATPPRATAEYDAWAVYYDLLHPGIPGEVEFYAAQALRAGGQSLELGCGTGRITVPIAMSGGDVTGLDISRNMLALCSEKAQSVAPLRGALHLVRADMRRFAFGTRFKTILMPYRTFMHLLTVRDQVACLECVHRHLAPGGRFLCNLWAARPSNLQPLLRPEAKHVWRLGGRYPLPGEACSVEQHFTAYHEEAGQLLVERHRVREMAADGVVAAECFFDMRRACVGPREMEHLLYRCGFEVEALCGDFDGAPFSASSSEMIWVARRKA